MFCSSWISQLLTATGPFSKSFSSISEVETQGQMDGHQVWISNRNVLNYKDKLGDNIEIIVQTHIERERVKVIRS
jgi:hypothetical protein